MAEEDLKDLFRTSPVCAYMGVCVCVYVFQKVSGTIGQLAHILAS